VFVAGKGVLAAGKGVFVEGRVAAGAHAAVAPNESRTEAATSFEHLIFFLLLFERLSNMSPGDCTL